MAADLAQVVDRLDDGAQLDEADRAALLAALDAVLSSRRRAKSMLRRDQFIRTIAASHYTGSTRARADRLGFDLKNYAASSWRRDKHSASMPARLRGTPQGSLWELLKLWPDVPMSPRHLFSILC